MLVSSFINPSCIFNDFIRYIIAVVSGMALSAENTFDPDLKFIQNKVSKKAVS